MNTTPLVRPCSMCGKPAVGARGPVPICARHPQEVSIQLQRHWWASTVAALVTVLGVIFGFGVVAWSLWLYLTSPA